MVALIFSLFTPEISILPISPISSIAITVSKSFCICWMIFPPGPITAPMNSLGISSTSIFGACGLTSVLGASMVFNISPRIWRRPSLACFKAVSMMSIESPWILISIWQAVIPSAVPVTLKSISPKWSSSPKISERTVNLPDSGSVTNPMAIPETGFVICTPASIKANVPAQTVAIEDEPLDSRISETIRIV